MKGLLRFVFVGCFIGSIATLSAQELIGADNDVRHVNNKLSIVGSELFYALPKNVVRVGIDLKQTETFSGPYSSYAKKYLNISEGVILDDELNYEIIDVQFSRYSTTDSSQFYSISYSSFKDFPELQLNEDGVIIACNSNNLVEGYEITHCQTIKPGMEPTEYLFADMGAKPFFAEDIQTLYRMVPTDSTPVKEAYKNKILKATSTEQNAEAAAAFILKLRKRKLKLLTGQFEEVNPIHGEAIETMVNSLNDLERKYLELFVGKTIEKKQSYYFDYIPSEMGGAEQKILCWFSPDLGIQASKPSARNANHEPVLIKSNPIGQIPEPKIQLMDNTQKSPLAIKYGLYYRIPGRIDITVQQIDKVLAKQQIQIAQKGKIVPLPVHYLNDARYSIEFHPETGALKRITKRTNSSQ